MYIWATSPRENAVKPNKQHAALLYSVHSIRKLNFQSWADNTSYLSYNNRIRATYPAATTLTATALTTTAAKNLSAVFQATTLTTAFTIQALRQN